MKPILLVALILATLAGLIAVAGYQSENEQSQHLVVHHQGYMLAVNFAHKDHTEQSCIACHHNYVDDTGAGMCFDCHKTDPTVSDLIETQFHDLCRGCHVDQMLVGADHGPTRQCIECHVPDDEP